MIIRIKGPNIWNEEHVMFKDRKTLYYIGLFIIFLALYKVIDNAEHVWKGFQTILSLLTPFFIAFFIAYLLRPLINWLERTVLAKLRFRRVISMLIVYAVVLGTIVLGLTIVIPTVIGSISSLVQALPKFLVDIEKWMRTNVFETDWFIQSGIGAEVEAYLKTKTTKIGQIIQSNLNMLVGGIVSFSSILLNLVIGLIVSAYLLVDKEKFAAGSQKLLHGFMSDKRAKGVIEYTKSVDRVFSQYFVGLILDALVIGTIVFIGLFLMGTPFALLIALIVMITNVIPYVGPFVGMLACGFILLMVEPSKALWATLFIFAVQQMDAYYINPKIMGGKVGVGPIWIILAVFVGGGLFGIMGMFVAVPVIAVIITSINSYVDRQISSRLEP
ncbi:AI-2E family transporter [Paenibacillus agilis]|nr:AI-2E family transporter [Paenibacillus agilis]